MGHRLLITISNQMYVTLQSMSEESSISIAEICRRSLDTTLGERGEKVHVELTYRPGRRSGKRIP
jgi:hypothetical protein